MKSRREIGATPRFARDWVRFVIRRISSQFPPIRDRLGLTPFPGRVSHLRPAPLTLPRYAVLLREAAFVIALKFKGSALLRSAQSARLEARGGRRSREPQAKFEHSNTAQSRQVGASFLGSVRNDRSCAATNKRLSFRALRPAPRLRSGQALGRLREELVISSEARNLLFFAANQIPRPALGLGMTW